MNAPSPEAPDYEKKVRFRTLIESALAQKGWRLKELEDAAKRLNVRGLTQNTVRKLTREPYAYSFPPNTLDVLAKLLDCDPLDWRADLGLAAPRRQPFFSREHVLKLQSELSEGDEVWVVSCREFLEVGDDIINHLVRKNLNRGVVYKYYFPARSFPYGTAAADSYAEFRRSLNIMDFQVTPQIVGFGLDTQLFPYFSKLHTLLYYKRPRGTDLPLAYIEYEGDESTQPSVSAWYRVKRDDFSAIKTALQRSCDPIADLEIEFRPMNPRLGNITRLYINSFAREENVERYEHIRELIGTSDQCGREVLNVFAATKNTNEHLRVLDVGCGDGTITSQIVAGLTESAYSVDITLLDPAPENLTVAQTRIRNGSKPSATIRVAGIRKPFEQVGDDEGYDLITAIHSLYVIDTDFLRKLYKMLNPGGVACIWMGSLQRNVLNQICESVDRALRPNQRRNYAEDIFAALELQGLNSSGLRKEVFHKQVPLLTDAKGELNDMGRLVTEFFAMQSADSALEPAARAALSMREGDGHPLQDWLIRFQKKL